MARPIRETPILTGKDAEVFVERMHEVENLSEDIREANRAKLLSNSRWATIRDSFPENKRFGSYPSIFGLSQIESCQ